MKVGIIGGGQLGQMLALSSINLGIKSIFLDPSNNCPASIVGEHICADFDDQEALAQLANKSDVVTFEFENVPTIAAKFFADKLAVFPPSSALNIARDRLYEKTLFNDLNIATPNFRAVNSQIELENAVSAIGLPAVIKTRTLGYDGKGQKVIKYAIDAQNAFAELGGNPLIVEQLIKFEHEISTVAVRAQSGEIKYYPITQNTHQNGILRLSVVKPNHPLQNLAYEYTARVLNYLNYVGVLAFEFFVLGDNLIANEIAPRVHNSGHWSIEGSFTSQFENHMRAVANLPLGDTNLKVKHCAMLNLIGNLPKLAQVLEMQNIYLHDYHKQSRVGRKVGHLTICANSADELKQKIEQATKLLNL